MEQQFYEQIKRYSFRSQKQSISNCKLCDGGSVLEYREKYRGTAGRLGKGGIWESAY